MPLNINDIPLLGFSGKYEQYDRYDFSVFQQSEQFECQQCLWR